MTNEDRGGHVIQLGAVFGSLFAAIISWQTNKSLIWAAIHTLFGWGYVLYRALGFGGEWV